MNPATFAALASNVAAAEQRWLDPDSEAARQLNEARRRLFLSMQRRAKHAA